MNTGWRGIEKRCGSREIYGRQVATVLQKAKAIALSGKPVLVNVWIGKTDFRKGSISM